ncbi:hypothetical protein FOMA001_g18203 [Fusarium oxysporum f. sp. matthiolae]|nr:hypothetical protein FOMA001_g18203 [Fusarium oxysporum f. sp. matthiolae]
MHFILLLYSITAFLIINTKQDCTKLCCQNQTPLDTSSAALKTWTLEPSSNTQHGPAIPSATEGTFTEDEEGAPRSSDHHYGDLTFFELGLGACGKDYSGQDETATVVALSHLLMGELSNNNPFCGKGVIIKVGGREVKAVVQDKCQACGINDIDVSQKVFREVFGSLALGRGKVEWWLED